ncbi:MAG: MFS transporter [Anaerolineae bacterium]|jgi:predicted MFS family arabinose efflux permease
MPLRRLRLELNRDARLILLSSLLYGVGFRGVGSLLRPLYVLRLGYGPQLFGIWSSMGPLAFMTFALLAGVLGTRLGVRRCQLLGGAVLVAGYAILPLCQLVSGPWVQVLSFASNLMASGAWSFLNTNQLPALTRATHPNRRMQAYALFNALFGLGAFVGSLLAGVMPGLLSRWLSLAPDGPEAYAAGLWVSVGLLAIALLPLLLLKPDERPAARPAGQPRTWPSAAVLLPLLVIAFLAQTGIAAYQMFGTAYMDQALQLRAEAIGSVVSVGQIGAMVAALAAPRLSRRWRPGRDVMWASWVVVLALAPVTLWAHWLPAAASYCLLLASNSLWLSMYQGWSMAAVAEDERAMVSGISNMAFGAAFATLSFGGGFVVAAVGYRWLFAVGMVLSAIGAAWLALLLGRARGVEPSAQG